MDSTVAFQTKGFGSSLQAFKKSVMALRKSSTLKNERTPAHAFGSQLSEPEFDKIQPTGTDRHKVRDDARVSFEPRQRPWMLMGPVVIHHQV